MPSVTKFVLDGTSIDITDSVAKANAAAALAATQSLDTRVTTIEELSRLTVAYNETQQTITFTTEAH